MDITSIAYQKYQLDWMIQHNYSIIDFIDNLQLIKEESDDDMSMQSLFDDWEFWYGFGGEIWVCFNEFMGCEFRDKEYMRGLLNKNEFKEYEKYIAED